MKKLGFCLALVVFCFVVAAQAQPKLISPEKQKSPPALAPVSFEVKYEGGMFGFNKNMEGTLKFDDANFRVVFFDKNNKEQFHISYEDLIILYPHTQTQQSTSGKVMQHIPVPGVGIAGLFMKDKRRYMVVNFDDLDMSAKGTINFKFGSEQVLAKAIQTLGDKAEMQQRGDSYFRRQPKQIPGQ